MFVQSSFRSFASMFVAALVLTVASSAQTPRQATSPQTGAAQQSGKTEISYSGHTYKFNMMGPNFGQISKDGQVAGTIIPDGQGGEKVLGVSSATPPQDILVAYGMYKAGGTPAAASTAPSAQQGASSGGDNAAGKFDAATNTATLPDGTVVGFVDENNAKVHTSSLGGTAMDYDLHYHGRSAGGALRDAALSHGGNVGGSLLGGGVTASLLGRQVWDTAEGTNLRGGFERIKPVAQAVFDAADAAKAAGHPVKSNVLESLLHNNADLHMRKQ